MILVSATGDAACNGSVLLTYSSAIWDNRSVFHSATNDYEGLGERFGHRTVGIGEKPYLDPNSRSRTEELEGLDAEKA